MGSDGKHKKSKKRRHDDLSGSDDSGSSSDGSGSSSSSGRERKSHKHHKDKKKKKKSKMDNKEKRMLKEAKKFLKKRLKDKDKEKTEGSSKSKSKPKPMLPVPPDYKITPLTPEDYFKKNSEFSKWLQDQKNMLFNELTSEETHSLFGEFVEVWNSRGLSDEYYAGEVGGVTRTAHKWGFQAEGSAAGRLEAEREERQAAQTSIHASRKAWRGEQKDRLDELLPKATGREAMLEKKAVRREAARERDVSPDMNRLIGGGDVMGGDDSFQAAKARDARRHEVRNVKQQVRNEQRSAAAAQARSNEDARMAAFRDLLSKGPINIPKRN